MIYAVRIKEMQRLCELSCCGGHGGGGGRCKGGELNLKCGISASAADFIWKSA